MPLKCFEHVPKLQLEKKTSTNFTLDVFIKNQYWHWIEKLYEAFAHFGIDYTVGPRF